MNIRLPAQWERQKAIVITWPHKNTDFAENLTKIEDFYLELTSQLIKFVDLMIACYDSKHKSHIAKLTSNLATSAHSINLYIAPSNDIWTRDHGPITIIENGKAKLLNFQFNGWGEKYSFNLDNNVTSRLYSQNAFKGKVIKNINFILEGGSIDTDGMGTLLTTKNCLLNPNRRKPYENLQTVEQKLKEFLGINRILWLSHGALKGDDTDSHIDTLVRFCNSNTICYVQCNNKQNENYDCLNKMEQELKELRTTTGKKYQLVPLPLPQIRKNYKGAPLPATYANFLITNNAVLVPIYKDTHDEQALNTLQTCFPKHKIVGINCSELIKQYGSLHCATMHIPYAS